MKRPVIELGDCSLCGVCEEVCPSVFILGDGRYVNIADLPEYPEAEVNEAIKNCPKDCITWAEED